MYSKVLFVSTANKLGPNIQKKITDTIDPTTFMISLSFAILLVQGLYIILTKKKVNITEYKNNPKLVFYLFSVAALIGLSSYFYNDLVKTESINKFTTFLQGSDLIMLLVLGLLFKDVKKLTKNHIIGLVLFFFGIYFYNK